MGRWATFRAVLLPQAFRRALPSLGNYWSEMVKDTSLTSALSVREFYFVFTAEIGLNQRTYEFLIVAGFVYLVLTSIAGASARVWEKHLSRGESSTLRSRA
jgi:ABC-type amino acid transport system permease subunit